MICTSLISLALVILLLNLVKVKAFLHWFTVYLLPPSPLHTCALCEPQETSDWFFKTSIVETGETGYFTNTNPLCFQATSLVLISLNGRTIVLNY